MGYEQEFEIQILKSYGYSFQDLFYRLMKENYSDFVPIKPHGIYGDNGCDGYLSNSGFYFQVYGPENPAKSLNNALIKMGKDFNKLIEYLKINSGLPQINAYIFVLNNKMDADISIEDSKKIEKLKEDNKKINFVIWDNQYLMGMFRNLNPNSQANILNIYRSNKDVENFLDRINNDDLISDIENIRKIKKVAENLMHVINSNDFVAPFPVNILSHFDILNAYCDKLHFNNENIQNMQNSVLSKASKLLHLILYYTKSENGSIGVMKRIEPWGEIKDEKFEDVRDRMLEARKSAYESLESFLAQEKILIQKMNSNTSRKF